MDAYLAKTQIGGVQEESSATSLSKEEKKAKEDKIKSYLDEYNRVNRPESLAEIYKRVCYPSFSFIEIDESGRKVTNNRQGYLFA